MEMKQLKKESEDTNITLAKLKGACKDLQRDNEEYRKVMHENEGFRSLQETVVQLSGIMVSKKSDSLNT